MWSKRREGSEEKRKAPFVKWRHLEVKGGSRALAWGRTGRFNADFFLSYLFFYLQPIGCRNSAQGLSFVWMPSSPTVQPGGLELPLRVGKTINWARKKKGKTKRTEQNTKPYMENLSQVFHFTFFHFFFSPSNIFSWSIITFNKVNKQIKQQEFLSFLQTFYWSLSLCCLCQNHNEPWKTTRCCWFVKTFVIGLFSETLLPRRTVTGLSLELQNEFTFTRKEQEREGGGGVQFQLYQWQASGTEHTDKQAKR